MISKAWGMLPAAANGDASKRTASDNQTVRNVFVIGPDKKIKLVLVYPMTTGRNFDEVLRVIDSLQLTAKHKVATPVNWERGEDVIIAGSVPDEVGRRRSPISALCHSLDRNSSHEPSCPRGEGRSVPGAGLTPRDPRVRPIPAAQVKYFHRAVRKPRK
jgi:hypothetical protein